MPRSFTSYGQSLALEPRAFGMIVMEPPKPPEARDVGGGVTVVDVRGPLMHHADPFCDSYDAIKDRVLGAIENGARTIVLAIDSPGGLVSGCFDTSDEIRAACDARGVSLLAYVDGQATSAAYALACVASRIYVPRTGVVGSIGILCGMIDGTRQDAAIGLTYSLVASGARKTDGNPHTPTTDAAVVAMQARVDHDAAVFFDHVSRRRGIATDKVAALQAGLVHGAQAVAVGLADEVASLDQVLALARAGGANAVTAASQEGSTMDENEKAVRSALQAILDGDGDEKAKAKAKAALAAYDGDEAKAEDETVAPPAKEPDGDEAAKASAATALAAVAAAGDLAGQVAHLTALVEGRERAELRASRKDLPDALFVALASQPLAEARRIVAAMPKQIVKPAATATVGATRGADQNTDGSARLAPEAKAALDARMGLVAQKSGVAFDAESRTLKLGVSMPVVNGAK